MVVFSAGIDAACSDPKSINWKKDLLSPLSRSTMALQGQDPTAHTLLWKGKKWDILQGFDMEGSPDLWRMSLPWLLSSGRTLHCLTASSYFHISCSPRVFFTFLLQPHPKRMLGMSLLREEVGRGWTRAFLQSRAAHLTPGEISLSWFPFQKFSQDPVHLISVRRLFQKLSRASTQTTPTYPWFNLQLFDFPVMQKHTHKTILFSMFSAVFNKLLEIFNTLLQNMLHIRWFCPTVG